MIYKQHQTPEHAKVGDAWVCPHKSFKRVLSRGGAWENVNLGSTHSDEVDHEQEQRIEWSEPKQRESIGTKVSSGAGESSQGNGDDGQMPGTPNGGEENSGVVHTPEAPENPVNNSTEADPETSEGFRRVESFEGEGVDGNGSPVV